MMNWTTEQLEEIALKIIKEGDRKNIRLRLLGGVAVYNLCKEIIAQYPQLQRTSYDIDFAGRSEDTKIIEEVLMNQGFKQYKEFNYINASSRMLFSKDSLKVDVILDEFRMNHRWLIKERLFGKMNTIPLEDMLLTKLQIVQPDEKDMLDLLALGLLCSKKNVDMEYIKNEYLSKWGFTYTVDNTCKKAIDFQSQNFLDLPEETLIVYKQIRDSLSPRKKTREWKFKTMISKRIRWYEIAEEPNIRH